MAPCLGTLLIVPALIYSLFSTGCAATTTITLTTDETRTITVYHTRTRNHTTTTDAGHQVFANTATTTTTELFAVDKIVDPRPTTTTIFLGPRWTLTAVTVSMSISLPSAPPTATLLPLPSLSVSDSSTSPRPSATCDIISLKHTRPFHDITIGPPDGNITRVFLSATTPFKPLAVGTWVAGNHFVQLSASIARRSLTAIVAMGDSLSARSSPLSLPSSQQHTYRLDVHSHGITLVGPGCSWRVELLIPSLWVQLSRFSNQPQSLPSARPNKEMQALRTQLNATGATTLNVTITYPSDSSAISSDASDATSLLVNATLTLASATCAMISHNNSATVYSCPRPGARCAARLSAWASLPSPLKSSSKLFPISSYHTQPNYPRPTHHRRRIVQPSLASYLTLLAPVAQSLLSTALPGLVHAAATAHTDVANQTAPKRFLAANTTVPPPGFEYLPQLLAVELATLQPSLPALAEFLAEGARETVAVVANKNAAEALCAYVISKMCGASSELVLTAPSVDGEGQMKRWTLEVFNYSSRAWPLGEDGFVWAWPGI